uniref:Uncharacterized protein n=1 Tax=Tetradesmus obliquus TaxID=3088 RepID=A0A383VJ81_TETOB|eukprot:jgi/Sobl393_1/4198/SZX65588.1
MPRPLTSGATRASGLVSKHSSSSRRGSQRGRSTTTRAYAAVPSVVDESSDPIIVAASWLGAKQRPFSKYKQLWQSLGFHSIISARPPMSSIMVPAAGQLLAAKFTHRLLQTAQQRPNAPILVHLFSGGGFIFMGWVFQILSELEPHNAAAADVRSRIRGVIFDSSPADVTADVSSRALVAAALGRPAEGIEDELGWLVKPTAAVVEGYLKLPFIRTSLLGMEQSWLQQAPACPKLFLYSEADVLIQPGVVEGFMAEQQAAGSQTYCYKWSDSAHVDHYRKYPEEYKQQLARFVQQVLPEQQQQQQQGQQLGGAGADENV